MSKQPPVCYLFKLFLEDKGGQYDCLKMSLVSIHRGSQPDVMAVFPLQPAWVYLELTSHLLVLVSYKHRYNVHLR